MAASGIAARIDDLMKRASDALSHMRYFEAERMANKALGMAREAGDFDRMARIVLPLQEARRQRYQQALDVDELVVIDQLPDEEETVLEPGCYLVTPPLVGADARRLRLTALNNDVPVAVICREPDDQLGQIPVVAITPGRTLRTKIEPPAAEFNVAWIAEATEQLGDFAIQTLDPELEITRRIDALVQSLDALPEHENLHMELEAACKQALHEQAEQQRTGKKPKKRNSKAGTGSER